MSMDVSSKIYNASGSLLLVAGMALAGYGGWLMTHLEEPVDLMKQRASLTDQCKAAATTLGYAIDHKGTQLTFSEYGLDDYEARLYRAGWLAKSCPGYDMERFCIGAGCTSDTSQSELALVLNYNKT